MDNMNETYPAQPDVILSDDTYAIRISIFENDVERGYHTFDEEEQHALRACIEDLITIQSSRFVFEIDSVIGSSGEWVTVLVCKMDGEYNVPFPLSLIDMVVYYSQGKARHLIGEKLLIHPRSDKYKWADKVELLLEEYDE
jgi:hypothetical protein